MTDTSRKKGKRLPHRGVGYGLGALCVALVAADAVYHKHAPLAVAEWFGFHAIYGFAAAVVIALLAGAVRRLVMRPADYYGDDD